MPGIGPERGIGTVAWVREDFVISCIRKNLCGSCNSGDEGKAAGESCQRRIMGELGDLQIVVISGHENFQPVGKLCVYVQGPSPLSAPAAGDLT